MLSEFSPIPNTPDGEQCRRWVDLDEPLWHNKTAFTALRLGVAEVNRLKRLVNELNHRLKPKMPNPVEALSSGARPAGIATLPLSPLN
jgi:hypothetical protein